LIVKPLKFEVNFPRVSGQLASTIARSSVGRLITVAQTKGGLASKALVSPAVAVEIAAGLVDGLHDRLAALLPAPGWFRCMRNYGEVLRGRTERSDAETGIYARP
jgi:hypothetical protein